MSLEKPISIIRKAVQGMAEEGASKEGLEKPEQRHYEDVFNSYKVLRLWDPERLKIYIEIAAKNQDLKKEIGKELFQVFDEAWIDATKNGRVEIEAEEKKLNRKFYLSKEKINEQLDQIDRNFLYSKRIQVGTNPKVIQAFEGKGEQFNKVLESVSSSMLALLKFDREAPENR